MCECIELWRERLYDIGWFMRGVNETIARMANEEENCRGRFWEGRYKSQALLDEAALLSCMAYVDLNPVRAGIEEDLFDSDFTSIQERLYEFVKRKPVKATDEKRLVQRVKHQKEIKSKIGLEQQAEAPLMPFGGSAHNSIHAVLPFTKQDYFELVDQTGRAIREDKRGAIGAHVANIVSRLGIKPNAWLDHVVHFGRHYGYCVGAQEALHDYSNLFDRHWAKGVSQSSRIYIS